MVFRTFGTVTISSSFPTAASIGSRPQPV